MPVNRRRDSNWAVLKNDDVATHRPAIAVSPTRKGFIWDYMFALWSRHPFPHFLHSCQPWCIPRMCTIESALTLCLLFSTALRYRDKSKALRHSEPIVSSLRWHKAPSHDCSNKETASKETIFALSLKKPWSYERPWYSREQLQKRTAHIARCYSAPWDKTVHIMEDFRP